jgi:hypothetical protein
VGLKRQAKILTKGQTKAVLAYLRSTRYPARNRAISLLPGGWSGSIRNRRGAWQDAFGRDSNRELCVSLSPKIGLITKHLDGHTTERLCDRHYLNSVRIRSYGCYWIFPASWIDRSAVLKC